MSSDSVKTVPRLRLYLALVSYGLNKERIFVFRFEYGHLKVDPKLSDMGKTVPHIVMCRKLLTEI